jgi:hypothetical protein
VYADEQLDEPTYKLTDLPDLSIIQVEPSSVLSFESPLFSRANQSEFKFNESRYDRDEGSYLDLVQPPSKNTRAPLVPRLNISEFSNKQPPKPTLPKERLIKFKAGLDKCLDIKQAKLQRAFDMLYLAKTRPQRETLQSLTFEFSREEPSLYKPRMGTFGCQFRPLDDDEPLVLMCSTDQPISKVPVNVRNSAFKLLSARLVRLLQGRYKQFFRNVSQPRYRY